MVPTKQVIKSTIVPAQRNPQRGYGANTKSFLKTSKAMPKFSEIEELDQYLSKSYINPESSAKDISIY